MHRDPGPVGRQAPVSHSPGRLPTQPDLDLRPGSHGRIRALGPAWRDRKARWVGPLASEVGPPGWGALDR